MKKIVMLGFAFLFILTITGCTNKETPGANTDDEQDSYTPGIVAILEDADYELTEHDTDAIAYFQTNTIDDLGVTATVVALYMGYLDGSNWVQVIGFETAAHAEAAAAALALDDVTQLVFQEGDTVVLTYTQATYDLLD